MSGESTGILTARGEVGNLVEVELFSPKRGGAAISRFGPASAGNEPVVK